MRPLSSPSILCGLAAWDFHRANHLIYPRPRSATFHPLEFLSCQVDAVEIPDSFHHPLPPERVRLWARLVRGNPRFQFTARLGRQFTLDRSLDSALIREFSVGLAPLFERGLLGGVLAQFPLAFRFTSENRTFLIRLRRAFHPFPLVAELRHVSWTCPEAKGVLIDHHVGFCNIDQPTMFRATPPTALLTWRVAYFKLYGRVPSQSWSEVEEPAGVPTRSNYSYPFPVLEEWQARISRLAPFAERTIVIFACDSGPRSVVNCLQLQSLVAGQTSRQPAAPARVSRVA